MELNCLFVCRCWVNEAKDGMKKKMMKMFFQKKKNVKKIIHSIPFHSIIDPPTNRIPDLFQLFYEEGFWKSRQSGCFGRNRGNYKSSEKSFFGIFLWPKRFRLSCSWRNRTRQEINKESVRLVCFFAERLVTLVEIFFFLFFFFFEIFQNTPTR